MSKKEYKFEVEVLEAGQRRKYGDSFYSYVIESELPVNMIKKFCTHVLNPAIPQNQYQKEEAVSFDNHFRPYYTHLEVLHEVDFLEDGYNKVEYKVVSPSTH